jgi:replicative DNA helicase
VIESRPKGLTEVFEDFHAWATDPRPRIGSGYKFFDGPTNGGAARGEFVQVLARSGVGKTWLAVNWIRNNPEVPTVFFSLEMAAPYIAARLAACETGASTTVIENALKSTGEHSAIAHTITKFPNLVIVDKPAMTIKDMTSALKEAEDLLQTEVRLAVVDYLELIGGFGMSEQVAAVDKTAKKMKDWAREHRVVALGLHQVSRGSGEEGHKSLSLTSGRYGGEQAADFVIGMFRPALEPNLDINTYNRVKDQVMLQLLKSRSGEADGRSVKHRMDSGCKRISEWEDTPWKTEAPEPVAYPSTVLPEADGY